MRQSSDQQPYLLCIQKRHMRNWTGKGRKEEAYENRSSSLGLNDKGSAREPIRVVIKEPNEPPPWSQNLRAILRVTLLVTWLGVGYLLIINPIKSISPSKMAGSKEYLPETSDKTVLFAGEAD